MAKSKLVGRKVYECAKTSDTGRKKLFGTIVAGQGAGFDFTVRRVDRETGGGLLIKGYGQGWGIRRSDLKSWLRLRPAKRTTAAAK